MHPGLVSPVFVGRGVELAGVVAALDSARAGNPAVVLVGGEAGVGKSRLVDEAAERARQSGTRVLTGSCIELGGEGLPLSPIVDALRSLIRLTDPDELERIVGPARQELARLLPELEPQGSPTLTPPREEGSTRLLELVFGVIQRLALDRPLMLVIEDLHWADRSTLELAALLVRALRGVRVTLVLTFRTDEIHRSHPLRPLVSEWERVRSVRRLELQRFTREEAGRQLEAILGAPPAKPMLDLLYERSEGNAFLIEEILGAIQAGADADELPMTLRDVLLARAERLSPPALRLLRIAAAAGRSVPDALLARVADFDEDALDAALREAIEHHLLVVDETGHGYRFRHELTRDAVYSDALPRERVRIHAAYAQALSGEPALAGSAAAAAAALALHFSAAHDIPRALEASVEAARLSAYAPTEALRHLERALELWPGVPDAAERCGTDVVELLGQAGQMAYMSGNLERSVALFDEALTELGDDGELERLAQLLVGQAASMQDLDRREEAVARLERAAALLPAEPPSVARADVLVALTSIRIDVDPREWRVVAQEALEAALAAGAREQEATARILLGGAIVYVDDSAEGIAELRRGLEIAEADSDHATALRGYLNLSDALEALGEHEEAAAAAARGLQLARTVGLTHHVYGAYLVSNCTEALTALGRWEEAEQLVSEALATTPPDMSAVLSAMTTMRGRIRALAGRYDEAASDLESASKAMSSTRSYQWRQPYCFARALLAQLHDDPGTARAGVREALEVAVEGAVTRYRWPLVWLGLRIEAEARQSDPERIAALSAEVVTLAAAAPPEQAYRALASSEAARAAGDAADWVSAIELARRSGDVYLLAYALLRGSESACAADDRDRAATMLGEAARLAEGMGAAPLLAEAQALARRARLRVPELVAAEPGVDGAPDGSLDSFGLTDREREVLELVAAGRTNPQIAAELFISPKTASVHVSNIISKLSVSSRGEAAALAHRLGLGALEAS